MRKRKQYQEPLHERIAKMLLKEFQGDDRTFANIAWAIDEAKRTLDAAKDYIATFFPLSGSMMLGIWSADEEKKKEEGEEQCQQQKIHAKC